MVGSKQGWVTGLGGGRGRRRVGQDWEAKCRRPNNGQAASTDLPTPSSYEASTCFPSVPRISDLQFARCGSLTRDALPFTRNPYTGRHLSIRSCPVPVPVPVPTLIPSPILIPIPRTHTHTFLDPRPQPDPHPHFHSRLRSRSSYVLKKKKVSSPISRLYLCTEKFLD